MLLLLSLLLWVLLWVLPWAPQTGRLAEAPTQSMSSELKVLSLSLTARWSSKILRQSNRPSSTSTLTWHVDLLFRIMWFLFSLLFLCLKSSPSLTKSRNPKNLKAAAKQTQHLTLNPPRHPGHKACRLTGGRSGKRRGGNGGRGRPRGPKGRVSGRLDRERESEREGSSGRGKIWQGEKQGGDLVQVFGMMINNLFDCLNYL